MFDAMRFRRKINVFFTCTSNLFYLLKSYSNNFRRISYWMNRRGLRASKTIKRRSLLSSRLALLLTTTFLFCKVNMRVGVWNFLKFCLLNCLCCLITLGIRRKPSSAIKTSHAQQKNLFPFRTHSS